MQNYTCPFCDNPGFDLIGLKSHLLHGDCPEFESTEDIKRVT